jgi:hypothetical protein
MEKLIVIITYLSNPYLSFAVSGLFTFSIVLFYLDDWKLSDNKIIKYLQIFSFVSTIFIIIITAYYITIFTDVISYIKDNDNNVNFHAHGHITLDKDAAKAVGQGLSTIGSQWGLGATMVGVSAAVGKAIAKSGMPPLQKAGVIVASSIIGGVGHSAISAANREGVRGTGNTTTPSDSYVNKLIDDSHVSPLQDLLFQEEILNYTCLSLVYILIIQLIFKLYFKNTIRFNLSKLLGDNFNTKLELYGNKIINLNKQMSIIWIWLIFVILIFGLGVNTYVLYKLLMNLDSFIEGYISFNPNFNKNNLHTPDMSIQDKLWNLNIANYISIFSIVFLMLLISLKFHYNKNVNNSYIWLILLVFIIILIFTGFTYGDLYANINNYVDMYINLKKK